MPRKSVLHADRRRGCRGAPAAGDAGPETGPGRASSRVRPGLVPRPPGRRLEPLARSVTMESAQGCPKRLEETDLGAADGPRRIRRTVGVLVTLDLTGSARRVR